MVHQNIMCILINKWIIPVINDICTDSLYCCIFNWIKWFDILTVCIFRKINKISYDKMSNFNVNSLIYTGHWNWNVQISSLFSLLDHIIWTWGSPFFSTNSYVYKAATHLTKSPNNSISELTWSGQYFNSCVGQPINNLKWLWRVPQGKWRTTIYYLLGRR